jgi:uncharacterized membrane protein YesL
LDSLLILATPFAVRSFLLAYMCACVYVCVCVSVLETELGLTLAKQALYHLSHFASHFCAGCLLSSLASLNHNLPICTSFVAGMTGHTPTQTLVEMGSYELFA